MKVLVIGYGIQGQKRALVAGSDLVGTVDPAHPSATYRDIKDVPLSLFDAALICTPDKVKYDIVKYLLSHGKHTLVEKPFSLGHPADYRNLETLCRVNQLSCYTAYNHRFEPLLIELREALISKTIGREYLINLFYGNGTARDVHNSVWRDTGLGVVADLGSHLLDLILFLIPNEPALRTELVHCASFENNSPDYCEFLVHSEQGIHCRLEVSLLSWRNTFECEVIGDQGSLHLSGLCKWGPSSLTSRTRVFPSGRPLESQKVIVQPDPTWQVEYAHFRELCRTGGTNLHNNIVIGDALERLSEQIKGRR